MLKEKWQKLMLREKVLLISGISVILSIPLLLIDLYYFIAVATTCFIASVFYNLYKFIQMSNISILEAAEINKRKAQQNFKEGKILSGAVRKIVLPLTICIGIPMAIIAIIRLWILI